jgi:hypothetical protein
MALYIVGIALIYRPYYLDYYSEAVGGPGQVYRHQTFEISWWGEGLFQGYDYLNQAVQSGQRVLILTSPDFSRNKLNPTIDRVGSSEYADNYTGNQDFDYIMTNPGYFWFKPKVLKSQIQLAHYDKVYTVNYHGAELAVVYKKVR